MSIAWGASLFLWLLCSFTGDEELIVISGAVLVLMSIGVIAMKLLGG